MSRGTAAARGLLLPVALAAVAYVLWDTVLVFPLKVLVVLLHEVSHGLAAVATGGSIVRIELSPLEGGLCVTRGGSRFLTLSAGYLGSAAFGGLFLVLGFRARAKRGIVLLLGIAVLAVTLLWVRTLFGFGWGVLFGAGLVALARWLPEGASAFVLRLVGVVSCLYAVHDIASDLLLRSVPQSDANALAGLTGIPGLVWGVLWMLVALAAVLLALRTAARG